jgi:hypothetical protein
MTGQLLFRGEYLCDVYRISSARAEVVQALGQDGRMSRQRLIDFEIALGELLQNIVRHEKCTQSPCHFSIELASSNFDLNVTVTDTCDLLEDVSFLDHEREASENGGMGVRLIKNIVSKYTISRDKRVNKHYLVFGNFLTPS